mmetsp:Transcript_16647/g.58048  ORF Transcript_16647/g.58048 Transcript_16647/m.58048 type:complete len:414 (-) Transcript_16647:162-1403(-)
MTTRRDRGRRKVHRVQTRTATLADLAALQELPVDTANDARRQGQGALPDPKSTNSSVRRKRPRRPRDGVLQLRAAARPRPRAETKEASGRRISRRASSAAAEATFKGLPARRRSGKGAPKRRRANGRAGFKRLAVDTRRPSGRAALLARSLFRRLRPFDGLRTRRAGGISPAPTTPRLAARARNGAASALQVRIKGNRRRPARRRGVFSASPSHRVRCGLAACSVGRARTGIVRYRGSLFWRKSDVKSVRGASPRSFSSPDHAAALARTAMYSELLPPLLQRLLGVSPLEFDSDRNTQLSALLVSFYEASFEPADPNADDAAADRTREFRDLFQHSRACSGTCLVEGCRISRRLLVHYKTCLVPICAVCDASRARIYHSTYAHNRERSLRGAAPENAPRDIAPENAPGDATNS